MVWNPHCSRIKSHKVQSYGVGHLDFLPFGTDGLNLRDEHHGLSLAVLLTQEQEDEEACKEENS